MFCLNNTEKKVVLIRTITSLLACCLNKANAFASKVFRSYVKYKPFYS